jgi:membrane-associated phospholipid phosphatase
MWNARFAFGELFGTGGSLAAAVVIFTCLVCGGRLEAGASLSSGLDLGIRRENESGCGAARVLLLRPYVSNGCALLDACTGEDAETRSAWNRLLGDAGSAVTTFASDAVHVYTSPFRLNKTRALWAGGVIVTTVVLYAYDEEINDWFQRNKGENWYGWFDDVGESIEAVGHMGKTNRYYFGALALGYVLGIEPVTTISAQILESHFIAGGLKNLLNVVVGRRRPFEEKGPYSYKFNDGTSFPSGHASNIIQVANILSHHFRYWPFRVIFFTLAASVCTQRIASQGHWASDVFIAGVFGYTVSREVLGLHEERKLAISPAVTEEGGLGVTVHFTF